MGGCVTPMDRPPPTDLLPRQFCGAGLTKVRENGRVWTGMRHSDPSSVSIVHWCPPELGQPSRMLERVGRDLAAAVAAWNRRAPVVGRMQGPSHG
jgi:hypothetical protein